MTNRVRELRPWGWYEILYVDEAIQIKRLCVMPFHQTSLQSHQHRAEQWVVISGIATVFLESKVLILHENETCFIKKEVKHRLSNRENVPLVLIEIQTGTYFGENDITRFEDDYQRN